MSSPCACGHLRCAAAQGYEDLPCEMIGRACTAYQDCVRENRDTFACVEQTTLAQLGTFFSEGASKDTPGWIWGLVGGAVLVFLVGVYLLVRKSDKHYPSLPIPCQYVSPSLHSVFAYLLKCLSSVVLPDQT